MDIDNGMRSIGRRIREIRVWRGMSLRAVAELAGISESYLSRIERGERVVDRRSLLEPIAAALRVAPSELAEQAFPPAAADPVTGEAQAAVMALEAALSDLDLGVAPNGPQVRPWAAVAADMNRLNTQLRPTTDYAAQGVMLPGLLSDLHALYITDPDHRADVLRALMDCYHATGVLLKNLGVRGLPTLAAFRAQRVAEELDDPAWLGLASWLRASTLGGKGRPRMLELSLQGADALESHLDDPRAQQMYGALHLNAALASAAMRQADDAADHLAEAGTIATRIDADGRGFGNLYFGPDNVGIWRVSIAVELGDPGRARELALQVNPAQVPSAARQAMYWADLGRGMASERATRDQAVGALLRAEKIAPQRIRTNPFVRETVADLMRRARREAVGRELRGMAYRMGIGVG
ncbi:MAG: helix-turn-helix domain-containing protein [Pseudonocardiaceae bacterium]